MNPDGTTNKTFLKNISILLVVNLIIKPIYIFGIDAQTQNMLGENQYGLYFGLFNFCMLFQIILDPGILNYNSQLISKNADKVESYFSEILGAKVLLIGIYVCIVMLSAMGSTYPKDYFQYLLGILGILILSSLMNYLRSHFSALGRYSYEAWFSGLDKFLMILILGYFLFVRKDISIHLFILGQVSALAISCIVFYIFMRGIFAPSIKFSIGKTVELIKQTAPYAIILLLMTLYTRLDGVMLERMVPDNAYSAGLYAKSFRLLDAANMIAILFATLMLPMFSKLIEQQGALGNLVENVTRLLFLICMMVSFTCWFYAKEIMDFIYINNTEEHYKVFQYLLLSFFFIGLSNIYGCLFLAKQRLKQINILLLGGLILNITLNLILIPEQGAFGAVIATLGTQIFVFLGQLILAIKTFNLRYSKSSYVGFLLIGISSAFIFKLFSSNIEWTWIIELVMISFLVLILAFLCGFLGFSEESRQQLY